MKRIASVFYVIGVKRPWIIVFSHAGSGGSMESLLLVVGYKIGLTKFTGSTYKPTWSLLTKQQRQGKVDGGVGSDCVEHLACKE